VNYGFETGNFAGYQLSGNPAAASNVAATVITPGGTPVLPIQGSRMALVNNDAVTFSQNVLVCSGTSRLEISAYFRTVQGSCAGRVCINGVCTTGTFGINDGWETLSAGAPVVAGTSVPVSVRLDCSANMGVERGVVDWVVLG
jgi:hypothetical protein